MKLVIDFDADPCVFIEATPEERDRLKRDSAAWQASGFYTRLVEQAETYSRIVAAQGDLLPSDWDASRALAEETRLHGTVHDQAFGLPVRVLA